MQVLQALLQFYLSHTCETRAKHTSVCPIDFEHEISGTCFEISPAVRKVPFKIERPTIFLRMPQLVWSHTRLFESPGWNITAKFKILSIKKHLPIFKQLSISHQRSFVFTSNRNNFFKSFV